MFNNEAKSAIKAINKELKRFLKTLCERVLATIIGGTIVGITCIYMDLYFIEYLNK